MNAKDRYKTAIKEIDDLLAGRQPENKTPNPKQLLEDVHRYCGELRRKVAALESQVEQDRTLLASGKQQLERLHNLPSKVEQLERAKSDLDQAKKKLETQRDVLQQRLAELEAMAEAQDRYSDVEDHTQVKVKCLECSLHFTLFTWSPEDHNARTFYCPECGQHEGNFLVWHEPGKGFIFQNVPGKAQIVEFGSRQASQPSKLDQLLDHLSHPSDN